MAAHTLSATPLLDPVRSYTSAVLAFQLQESPSSPFLHISSSTRKTYLERIVRLAARRDVRAVILLGVGSGPLAADLAAQLPVPLLISEFSPAAARNALALEQLDRAPNAAVLADTSFWAHLLIWTLAGLCPDNTLVALNPELPPAAKSPLQRLQKTFAASQIVIPGPASSQCPDITLAAMLHPDEPDIPGFLAGLPRSCREATLLWDASQPPGPPLSCPLPFRQAAHPLGEDFSAQRNRMQDMVATDWLFYLDADERIPSRLDERLPALTRLPGVHGIHFPRQTLFPDDRHFKVGYGLWPDLQLRLFRKGPGVRFERPIHEHVVGLPGRQAVFLDASILHLSRLLKQNDQIRAKLDAFNACGAPQHHLSEDYPVLPLEWLAGMGETGGGRVLLVQRRSREKQHADRPVTRWLSLICCNCLGLCRID